MVILYHGTSDVYLDEIRAHGLRPSSEPGYEYGREETEAFTLSNSKKFAEGWARITVDLDEEGGNPVVITFEIPESEAPDYLLEGTGEHRGEFALRKQLPSAFMRGIDYLSSSDSVEDFYKRRPGLRWREPVHVRPYRRRR